MSFNMKNIQNKNNSSRNVFGRKFGKQFSSLFCLFVV